MRRTFECILLDGGVVVVRSFQSDIRLCSAFAIQMRSLRLKAAQTMPQKLQMYVWISVNIVDGVTTALHLLYGNVREMLEVLMR